MAEQTTRNYLVISSYGSDGRGWKDFAESQEEADKIMRPLQELEEWGWDADHKVVNMLEIMLAKGWGLVSLAKTGAHLTAVFRRL